MKSHRVASHDAMTLSCWLYTNVSKVGSRKRQSQRRRLECRLPVASSTIWVSSVDLVPSPQAALLETVASWKTQFDVNDRVFWSRIDNFPLMRLLLSLERALVLMLSSGPS